jgi:4-diphosphocytidyl-2-C-methyl-D-erythritol kinase
MRGRGERLYVLPAGPAERLRGRRVLVFKPGFPIATGWAYARLAASGKYWAAEMAEAWLGSWLASEAPAEELLANNMEAAAFAKYPALPVLLDQLRADFGLAPRMSGSGSACFTLLPEHGGPSAAELSAAIADAWGPHALVVETRLA